MATLTQEQFARQLADFVKLTKSTESPWTLQVSEYQNVSENLNPLI